MAVVIHVLIERIRPAVTITVRWYRTRVKRIVAKLLLKAVKNAIAIHVFVGVIADTVAVSIEPLRGITGKGIALINNAIVVDVFIDAVGNSVAIKVSLIRHIRIRPCRLLKKIGQPVTIAVGVQMIGDAVVINIADIGISGYDAGTADQRRNACTEAETTAGGR